MIQYIARNEEPDASTGQRTNHIRECLKGYVVLRIRKVLAPTRNDDHFPWIYPINFWKSRLWRLQYETFRDALSSWDQLTMLVVRPASEFSLALQLHTQSFAASMPSERFASNSENLQRELKFQYLLLAAIVLHPDLLAL